MWEDWVLVVYILISSIWSRPHTPQEAASLTTLDDRHGLCCNIFYLKWTCAYLLARCLLRRPSLLQRRSVGPCNLTCFPFSVHCIVPLKKTILSLSHDPVLLEEPAIFKQSAFEFFFRIQLYTQMLCKPGHIESRAYNMPLYTHMSLPSEKIHHCKTIVFQYLLFEVEPVHP